MHTKHFEKLSGFAVIVIVMLNFSGLKGQDKIINRKPAVSGQFYPGTKPELSSRVKALFKAAEMGSSHLPVQALLVPHAGYDFSGQVAASAFKQLADLSAYDKIFILASSHRVNLGKASVYSAGNYQTPMGEVKVNREIAKELLQNSSFCFEPSAHVEEHSIEVQLPFLQHFGEMPSIIPIVLASQVPTVAKEIANTLQKWFTPNNLFIISADFSHYPKYEDAIAIDKLTADAFCTGDPVEFLNIISSNEKARIKGLATSICAWPAALTLLYLAEHHENLIFEKIKYANSGDNKEYGDKKRVVGYHSISLRNKNLPNNFYLSNRDKFDLISLARETLNSHYYQLEKDHGNSKKLSKQLNTKAGAFVTLKINHKLRGCIGSFDPSLPLHKLIPELTISSASKDRRFLPVQSKDLKNIEIEISVLTPMRKIRDISEIELGKHGIYMKKGSKSGTFLPQVATETGWDLEEFLGRCSQDKAGIGYTGWKEADLYVYEAIVFKEL